MKKISTYLVGFILVLAAMFSLAACKKVEHKISFIVDSQEYYTINTNGNEVIKMPDDPIKENYTFDGWYWDENVWKKPFTAESLLSTPLSSNMSVYAHFLSEDDVFGTDLQITGFSIVENESVGKAYYIKVDNNIITFSFDDKVTVSNKSTWSISTDVYGNNTIASKTVNLSVGNNIYYIQVTDQNSNLHQYPIVVRRRPIYKVIFDSNGGTSCNPLDVEEDKYITAPSTTRDGYEFVSWNYDFTQPITSDLIISARWSAKKINVNLNANGGSCNKTSISVTYGTTYTLPTPTREGFVFLGWYHGTSKVDSTTWNISSDCTLVAHWNSSDPDLALKDVTFTGKTFTYDGTQKSIAISGTLPDGVSVSYTNNNKVNAGEYTVTAHFTDNSGLYGDISDLCATLIINKATYDLSGISFSDASYTYDGTLKNIEIIGTLPNGVTVEYVNNGKINAGTYTVTARFTGDSENYNYIPEKTAKLTISKATYDMSYVSFGDDEVVYNGMPHSIGISGTLPNGVSVLYTGNAKTNVGTYTVTAKFTGDSTNYNAIPNMTAQLRITKATYDMSNVKFEDKEFTYDGNPYNLEATNLPAGVSVTYTGNSKKDVGVYTVVAHFSGDSNNYNLISDMSATMTINKFLVENIKFEDKTVTYNGQVQKIEVVGIPRDITVVYGNNNNINAGTYVVTVSFEHNDNYEDIASMNATLVIEKATYNMSNIAFTNTKYSYDGNEHQLTIVGNLPSGVSVEYQNNKLTNVGSTLATAVFSGDYENYNEISNLTATLEIEKLKLNTPHILFDGEYVEWDIIPFADSYIVTINGVESTVNVEYIYIEENIRNKEFTVSVKATGNLSNVIISEKSNEIHKFDEIKNVSINNGVFTWDEIDGCEGYLIKVNGTTIVTVTTNNYHFKTIDSGTFNVSINAVGKDDFASTISGNAIETTITKLSTPVLTYENGSISWNEISNAISYTVLVDGEELTTITSRNYTLPQSTVDGTHQVTIRANGGNSYIDSYSSVSTVSALSIVPFGINGETLKWTKVTNATDYIVFINNQKFCYDSTINEMNLAIIPQGQVSISIIALANMNGTINYSVTAPKVYTKLDSVTGIAVSNGNLVWNSVTYATSYVLTINGFEYEVQTNLYDLDNVKVSGEYEIAIVAKTLGTIDSTTVTFTAEILSTPIITIDGEYIKWEEVNGVSKYVLTINDVAIDVTTTQYKLENAGTHSIQIKAIGDDTKLSSALSNVYTLTKLATPTNIKVQNGKIVWDSVVSASSYTVLVDGIEYISNTNSFDARDIQTSGTAQIAVFANGNNTTSLNSAISSTQTFRTLTTPSVSYDKDTKMFSWDAVLNADHYEVDINGTIYNNSTNTTFDFTEYYKEGYFEVKVYAIGTNRLNSNPNTTTIAVYGTLTATITDNILDFNRLSGVASYDIKINDSDEYNILSTSAVGIDLEDYHDNLSSIHVDLNNAADYYYGIISYDLNVTNVIKSWLLDGIRYNFNSGSYSVNKYVGTNSIVELLDKIGNYNVTSIDSEAFMNSSISTLKISKNITSIGSNAFKYSTFKIEWAEDSKITSITANSFDYYYGTELTIPSSVTSIASGALRYTTKIQTLTVPFIGGSRTSNTHFGFIFGAISYSNNSSFVLTSLKKVIISNGISSVEENAFYGCSSLTEIVVPNSVTTIGKGAFRGCSSLTKITLPFIGSSKTDTYIPTGVFGYIFGYEQYYKDTYSDGSGSSSGTLPSGAVIQYAYSSNRSSGSIQYTRAYTYSYYIPTTIREVVITNASNVPSYAFYNCDFLTSITINEGITAISEKSFGNCRGITMINLPSTVTTIGNNAFDECNNLRTMNFDGTIIKWANISFGNSRSNPMYLTKELYISGSKVVDLKDYNELTRISSYAFVNWNITSLTIPASVETVGTCSFEGANAIAYLEFSKFYSTGCVSYLFGGGIYKALKEIKVNNVSEIIANAFFDYSSVTKITLPSTVTKIRNSSFYNCSSLNGIIIPNEVTTIEENAFYGCSSLTEIVVPDSVTTIGKGAFRRCSSLTKITLPFIGSSKTNTNIPTGVFGYIFGYEQYYKDTYSDGSGSSSGTMPYGTIIQYAYSINMSSGSIQYTRAYTYSYYIPTTIREVVITNASNVPSYAFNNCDFLTSITINEGAQTNIGILAFNNCNATITYH